MFFPLSTSLWLARLSVLPIFLALIPAPAWPGGGLEWREAQTMAGLVDHLDAWLDRHTDLAPRGIRPSIRIIGPGEAATLAADRRASAATTLRGLYDPETETISLVRPWDPRDPFDVGTLLHELVHHRQNGHGHWYCPGAQELPAYRIQQSWLAGLGLEPNVNWIAVVLESGCTRHDIHPD